MKKFIGVCLVLALLSPLSACQSAELDTISYDENFDAENEHLTMHLTDNIAIDADCENTNLAEASVVTISFRSVNATQAQELFFEKGSPIITEHEGGYVIESSDGSRLFYEHPSLSYSTELSGYLDTVLALSGEPTRFESIRKLSTTEEFDFCSRDKAADEVRALLQELGFADFGATEVFALNHTTMESAEQLILNNPQFEPEIASGRLHSKNTWSVEDDCYVVVIETEIEGIQIISDGLFDENVPIVRPGGRILAYYAGSGLVGLSIPAMYTVDTVEAPESIITLGQAIGLCQEKIGSIITSADYTITNISLCYLAEYSDSERISMELLPVWQFSIHETGVMPDDRDGEGAVFEQEYLCYFNALTGKEAIGSQLAF
jgi:hypothetical protein